MIPPATNPMIQEYDPEEFFDELFSDPGDIRPEFSTFDHKLSELSREELFLRQQSADRALMRMGITFQVYGDKLILKDGVVPEWVVYSSSGYLQPCEGLKPPLGVWCQISGSDIVRNEKGEF